MTNDETASALIRPDRGGHEWLPLDTARDAFGWLVTGPKPMAVQGARFAGLPRRPVPLDELRDRVMSKQCPPRTRDDVWAHLVLRSRTHGGAWTVACVGMALPSLAASARWLAARYRGDRADAHAAVLAGFVHALSTVDLADPAIAVRLHFAARRAGQEALEESLDAPMPAGSGYRSAAPRPPYGHPDLVLARAVGEQILTPAEAELISATRLGDTSVTDWAHRHGAALKTAFKARDRAEDRLVAWLRDQVAGAGPEDPVADAAVAALVVDPPDAPAEENPGVSRAVSGRLRNGRPASSRKSSRAVSKNDPKSGLLGRGETSPGSPRTAEHEPTSEVRRCA
ncbi:MULTISPECIES: hypothetical protein [Amycolatopsis]|uniref:DNA-directed RNA polymerase specialized sigma24 family protein n=1 Tax=Amycolatopsis echigonensis TaxID=2576905 RepID=A0A2N3WLN7_9PSEU|nr:MULTISPECIES: hypothetical protein [Amycolatopsis]MBB2501861.1 hypothetical protein [Amycolatopsis echigonensis]MCG3751323.1 hypothetical protein [Amycolatopsis sp. Poz14]PKV94789.1 hypothetical protein ATK30_5674 [Amycolatopsis niigatensis]